MVPHAPHVNVPPPKKKDALTLSICRRQQLARYFGAAVYATGGGDRQLARIEELGATGINDKTESVADYLSQPTAGSTIYSLISVA